MNNQMQNQGNNQGNSQGNNQGNNPNPNQDPKEQADDKRESENLIKELGLLATGNNFKSNYQYINIIGCIEGHTTMTPENKTTKYEHLIPQLVAVEENPDIKGMLLILNTVGGDVEAGLALAEIIASISKPVVTLVVGGGHSIGIPLAVSGDYSFVAKSATMTMHPIRTSGTLITADATFEYLRKTQDRVVDFITEHSKAKKKVIEEKMNKTGNMSNDVGTVLFGEDAVDMGLIDEVGGLSQALGKLKEMAER